ncbi:RHS repeat-associated core domain-containing protein, partial [Micromonospora sp. DT81.3]|uniref:RHS repeat-associated core domain-containing protein n=1 Tax=Micromonospora sp. DT81.3 TaxID=3416523 RepID=UPI003CED01DC
HAVSWAPNRLDVFGRGTDGTLQHWAWDGTAWGGPGSLGGALADAPHAVSSAPNRLDVFGRGTDGTLQHWAWDGTAWGGPGSLGGALADAPHAVSSAPNRVDVFGRGTDGTLQHWAWDGTAWGGPGSLGGTLADAPHAVSWAPNRVDVFGRGTDGTLQHWAGTGRGWGDPTSLGGTLTDAPHAVSWAPRRMNVFGRGTDGTLQHWAGTGRGWGGPTQQRRFRYDSLGRLIRQYLPERGAGIPETVGGATEYWSESFAYDARSNLVQMEDSRGIVSDFDYNNDPFDRLGSVSRNMGSFRDHEHPVAGMGVVFYHYETTGDLRRVHEEICSGASRRVFHHDPVLGLVSVVTTMDLAPNRPFTIDYGRDQLARVRTTTFPAQYGDGAGNQRPILEVARRLRGLVDELYVNGDTLVHDIADTAAGQIAHLLIGPDDIDETYKRDLPNPLLLSGQSLRHGNGAISNVDYRYHPAATASGQPPQLHVTQDLLDPSGTRVAVYDRLGRLRDYAGGPQPTGTWGEKYTYDLHGNRLGGMPRGEIVSGTPTPSDGLQELSYEYLTNRILTAGFDHDAAGNVTAARINGVDYKYQYDLAGRLAWVHNGATQEITGYLFGACNRRRGTIRVGATTWPPTHHPGGVPPTEIKSATFYIWDEDTVIATYEANGPDIENTLAWKELSFNLGDRLLSTWGRVDSNLKRVHYLHPGRTGTRYVTEPEAGPPLGVAHEALPYGGALVSNAGISSPFTSYDRDTSTGLDYAVNRFYHPELGRFLQPDPLGAGAFNPYGSQSLNAYAYCGDDPVNHTDPLGLVPCMVNCWDWDGRWVGGGGLGGWAPHTDQGRVGGGGYERPKVDKYDPSGTGWDDARLAPHGKRARAAKSESYTSHTQVAAESIVAAEAVYWYETESWKKIMDEGWTFMGGTVGAMLGGPVGAGIGAMLGTQMPEVIDYGWAGAKEAWVIYGIVPLVARSAMTVYGRAINDFADDNSNLPQTPRDP